MSWTFEGIDKGVVIAGVLSAMAENLKGYTGNVKIDLNIEYPVDEE